MGLTIKWLTRIGIILLIILVINSLIGGILLIGKSNAKIEEAKKKVAEEQKRNEDIKKQLEEISSQAFTEQMARDKLGLARLGETVIVLPDKEILRKLAPRVEDEEETLPDPNWQKWLKLFL